MTSAADTAAEIRGRLDVLSDTITARQFAKRPELAERWGEQGRLRCREDAKFHLSYLAAALDVQLDDIFIDYVAWAKTVLVSRNVSMEDLDENLAVVSEVLNATMRRDLASTALATIAAARRKLPEMPVTIPTFIDASSPAGAVAGAYLQKLLTLDSRAAMQPIAEALGRGMDVPTICFDVLEPVQHEIGRLWQLNKISVALEHFCSSVTQQLLGQFSTSRHANPAPERKRVIAMCAPGELHEIGLRAITEVLALAGWNVIHLGANVPAAAAVQMCIERKPEVILISATLPPHIAGVAQVVRLVRSKPALAETRIYVGGRAFAGHPDLWRFTGADGWAPSAASVAKLVSEAPQ